MENEVIHEGVFGQMVGSTIDKARNGDTESARKILKWFCGAIKANTDKNGRPYRKPSGLGTQIDERILRYVGECFQKILDDGPGARVNANHALGIVEAGKKGNKKTKASRQHELDLGYEVIDCYARIKEERKKLKQQHLRGEPAPLEEAIKEIARKYHKSISTVKNAYDEWKKILKSYKEDPQKMGK
jgi:hypothetical protein